MLLNKLNLTPRDKMNLIVFRNHSSRQNKVFIDSNRAEWLQEILSDPELKNEYNELYGIQNRKLNELVSEMEKAGIADENIRYVGDYLQNSLNQEVVYLNDWDDAISNLIINLSSHKTPTTPGILEAIYKFIQRQILFPMFIIYDIYERDSEPDEDLYINMTLENSQLKNIAEQLIGCDDNKLAAFLIFSLNSLIGLTTDSEYSFMINVFAQSANYDSETVFRIVKIFDQNRDRILNDKLCDDESKCIKQPVIRKFDNEQIVNNYKKDRVSEDLGAYSIYSNRAFIFGEHLPDLVRLINGRIGDYVNEDMVTYLVTDKDIGHLSTNGYSIAKIMKKNGDIYTAVEKDDITYLIYHLYGDDTLYGISFPEDNDGSRKHLIIDIPSNINYMIKSSNQ